MFDLLLQSALIFAMSWILWLVLRSLVVKSSLRHLPGPPRASLIFGNLSQLHSAEGIPWHHAVVRKYGRVFKFYGLFGQEGVYVTDPLALHHILVKDQSVYEETSRRIAGNKLIFGDGLLSTLGDHHKRQRKMLNPAFSIAHMRDLTPIFYRIAHQLRDELKTCVNDTAQVVDVLEWMSRTALECIGQGGLGYSFEMFTKEGNNEYSHAVRNFFPSLFRLVLVQHFLPFAAKFGPPRFRKFLWDLIPLKAANRASHAIDTIHSTAMQVFETKKRALLKGDESLQRQVGEGKDVISVLMKANMLADETVRLPEHELVAQLNTLIAAAHGTTSTALSRILCLLALHPVTQELLRKEVTEARAEKGDLGYDDLMALPYLDAIVRESLRLYPPVTFSTRTARRPIILPLSTPIQGTTTTEIHIPENTDIIIGIGPSNRDTLIWGEDAIEWKPERWLGKKSEQVANIKLPGVYAGMMTFLGGGRACIGFKFSELEMKVVLSVLIETFVFEETTEIFWRNGGLAIPSTKGKEHCLPMKVKPATLGNAL